MFRILTMKSLVLLPILHGVQVAADAWKFTYDHKGLFIQEVKYPRNEEPDFVRTLVLISKATANYAFLGGDKYGSGQPYIRH